MSCYRQVHRPEHALRADCQRRPCRFVNLAARGGTDLTKRIKCDIWYLENWSVLLDFQIMLMTFVKHENAA